MYYPKLNVSYTLGLKITKPSPLNPSHLDLSNNMNVPNYFSLILKSNFHSY
jgi:hypothetical protein